MWLVRRCQLSEDMPGDMNCQRMWTVRQYDLSDDVNCQRMWTTVRGCKLSENVNWQGIWTLRGCEMSEDVNC